MQQTSRHPRNDAALKALVLSASVLFCATAGEIGLRMIGYGGAPQTNIDNAYLVDDPILDWRYLPNSERKSGRVVYKFNSAGFRDVSHVTEKPPGVRRIVVVGDSVSEGTGVDFEDMFSRVLQSELGAGYEVITLAQGGLNTPQEVHLLEMIGLAYEPDVVIVNFILNDCDFPTQLEKARQYIEKKDSEIGILFGLPIDPRFKSFLKSSALIYFVKERVGELYGRIFGEENRDYFREIWEKEKNLEKVSQGLERFAHLGHEHGFDGVVVIWPLLIEYPQYPFGDIHRWVEGEARRLGLDAIDLLPEFSRLSYRNLQVAAEDNVHPNALGHRRAVEILLTLRAF